jgi:hypothetical protein
MPRDWSIQPAMVQGFFLGRADFGQRLARSAARSASIAGTNSVNFSATTITAKITLTMITPMAAAEARLA